MYLCTATTAAEFKISLLQPLKSSTPTKHTDTHTKPKKKKKERIAKGGIENSGKKTETETGSHLDGLRSNENLIRPYSDLIQKS